MAEARHWFDGQTLPRKKNSMTTPEFAVSLSLAVYLIVGVDEASKRLEELIDRAIAGEKVAIALDNEHLIQLSPIQS